MALSTVRYDLHPAPLTRTVTTAGAQIVLADATNTPIAANPQGVNHLPFKLLVYPIAGSLVWLDSAGTSNTLVVPAAAAGTPLVPFELPGTAKSIEAGTTAGFQIVVAWHSAP